MSTTAGDENRKVSQHVTSKAKRLVTIESAHIKSLSCRVGQGSVGTALSPPTPRCDVPGTSQGMGCSDWLQVSGTESRWEAKAPKNKVYASEASER